MRLDTLIYSRHEQGSAEWLADRLGVITGSQFKLARDRTKKGEYSSKANLYAMDTARERVGGTVLQPYQNAAMKIGSDHEPMAIAAYERLHGPVVDRTGFVYRADRKFGVSPDGLVGDDGMIEVKTLVGSDALFTVLVERDYSSFIDQIMGSLWLLNRQWCDLILGVPDLADEPFIVRLERDDDTISALERDLIVFDGLVSAYEESLRKRLGR